VTWRSSGEDRLGGAIGTDISDEFSHARALDADTKGPLREIHRRVGSAILFECSGGQSDKAAHLPELRFALGGPEIDTTSIDTAAQALEGKSFFIRRVGTDGYRIGPKAKLNKVMAERRAALDDDRDVLPECRKLVRGVFEAGSSVPAIPFPEDGASIQDTPRLGIVVADPASDWDGNSEDRQQIADWTLRRGGSDRFYPASLIWCVRKPGRDLRNRVETWLAWRAVAKDLAQGTLGEEIEDDERRGVQTNVKTALEDAKEAVWSDYRFIVFADRNEADGVRIIDLGAGHSSAAETIAGRVLSALRSQGLLNETVGAGYIERKWPPALADTGAWPLTGLRQAFLDGSLTRLIDPDRVLRGRIVEFVTAGDFGLASGAKAEGGYDRVWFREEISSAEISFEADVYLLRRAVAARVKTAEWTNEPVTPHPSQPEPGPLEPGPLDGGLSTGGTGTPGFAPQSATGPVSICVAGSIPPEQWNRLGTKLIPKLRAAGPTTVAINLESEVDPTRAATLSADLQQVIDEIGLSGKIRIEQRQRSREESIQWWWTCQRRRENASAWH
jgi:hypothetical protein